MGKQKYTEEQMGFAKRALRNAAVPRDSLPYHKEFARIHQEYSEAALPHLDKHGFWLLLSAAGKEGGAKQTEKTRLPPLVISTEEAFELQRLCPESIGARDRLPYTTEFEEMHTKFMEHTGRRLSRNEFWRALSRVAKKSRKPQPVHSGMAHTIPGDLQRDLLSMNPWWEGGTQRGTPDYRRTIYETLYDKVTRRLHRVVAVRGPRQVGKTTLQSQMINDILHRRRLTSSAQVLRVQFDDLRSLQVSDPIIAVVDWYERNILKETINNVSAKGRPVYLFFDEIQDVPKWSSQLKHVVDFKDCQVYITGSSALRIAHGTESLAGRMDLCILPPLSLVEIAGFRGLADVVPFENGTDVSRWRDREFWVELSQYDTGKPLLLDDVYAAFSAFGGYPFCHSKKEVSWKEATTYLANAVISRTIDHDLRAGGGRRDSRAIKEVFKVALKYAGQATAIRTLARELNDLYECDINQVQTRDYLDFLENSLLIKLVEPIHLRCRKDRPEVKICVCDHGLRAAWLKETISLINPEPHNMDLAGHIVESIVGYFLGSIEGGGLAYFPPRDNEPEVDYIIESGDTRIPVEVKYRNDPLKGRHLEGLRSFIANKLYNAKFGVILTKDVSGVQDNIIAMPVKRFLLMK